MSKFCTLASKYRVTSVVGDWVMFTFIWLFHSLPDSTRAAANWAEIAEQLGNIVQPK